MNHNFVAPLLALSLSTIGCGPDELMDAPEVAQPLKAGKVPRDTGTDETTSTTTTRVAKRSGKTTKTTTPEVVVAPVPVYALRFADERVNGEEPVWKNAFVVADTHFVEIATEVPASLTGHHTLHVYLREPTAGNVYQRFDVAFASGVAANPDEVEAEVSASGFRVWVSLPVKGTFIDSFSLHGTWSVESWIDSNESPVVTGEFDLQ